MTNEEAGGAIPPEDEHGQYDEAIDHLETELGKIESDLAGDEEPAPAEPAPPTSALEMIGMGPTDVTGGEKAARVDSLGNQELAVTDPAALMLAAQMEAAVKARFGRAMAKPRDEDAARMGIEKECRRPGFAEVARYDLERHSRGSGPSARFAELAARKWGNLDVGSFVVADTKEARRVYCYATDLETNWTEHEMIVVVRSVERSSGNNREVLQQRQNSRGKPVYVVRATDEEMDAKAKNYVSRTLRVLRLRHIPGDLVDDCMAIVVAVQRDSQASDPDRFRKIILRTFMTMNVTPDDLAEYLGKPFAKASQRELGEIKSVGVRIQGEDDYTWGDALAAKLDQRGQASKGSGNDAGGVSDAIASARRKAQS